MASQSQRIKEGKCGCSCNCKAEAVTVWEEGRFRWPVCELCKIDLEAGLVPWLP